MRAKIEAMIALVSFGSLASAHVSIIPAMIALEITKSSTVGMWVYVASFVPVAMVCTWFFLSVAAQMNDALSDKGQWVTVESSHGQPSKRVFIPPPFYKDGERRPEVEREMRDAE